MLTSVHNSLSLPFFPLSLRHLLLQGARILWEKVKGNNQNNVEQRERGKNDKKKRVKKRNGKKEEINYSQKYKWLVDS